MNLRPLGYDPSELPRCSTPRCCDTTIDDRAPGGQKPAGRRPHGVGGGAGLAAGVLPCSVWS